MQHGGRPGASLRRLRLAAGVTIDELADALGITPSAMAAIERGDVTASRTLSTAAGRFLAARLASAASDPDAGGRSTRGDGDARRGGRHGGRR